MGEGAQQDQQMLSAKVPVADVTEWLSLAAVCLQGFHYNSTVKLTDSKQSKHGLTGNRK